MMLRHIYKIAKTVFSQRSDNERGSSYSAKRFGFETLESKELLAAMIDYDPFSRVVTVEGDAANDVARAFDENARVVITLDGFGERSFVRNAVDRIDFFGRDGNDTFQSSSVIPVRAFGNGGDDSLTGGVSDDMLNGGDGVDRLFGNLGNDRLFGGDGNDQLNGGDGNDRLSGGRGNDRLNGQGGDDSLFGDGGNDFIHGDGGNDRVFGNAGDDELFGDNGEDILKGHGGDDILRGGFDNDKLFGGIGNDMMFGDQGEDRLNGHDGDDEAYGGSEDDYLQLGNGDDKGYGGNGNDRIVGFDGNDMLWGEVGNDFLIGNAGSDQIWGGHGADILRGTTGNDILHGEAGPDILRGDSGNDSLYGGHGLDKMWGGSGMDGLFGGIDTVRDRMFGQSQEDRYLFRDNDVLGDRFENSEAIVLFEDGTGQWTDREVEVVDEMLREFHFRTNNTSMLVDTISDRPIVFVKNQGIAGGAAGLNNLEVKRERFFNQENLRYETRTTFKREIIMADWDETNEAANSAALSTSFNLMAKNYDSIEEMVAVDGENNVRWRNFLEVSNWTNRRPDDPTNYELSRDGLWWYTDDSVFAKPMGNLNPSEDWSTIWDHYFTVSRTNPDPELSEKLGQVDQFFRSMTEL